jgi:dolichol-phosphate mannosyltransferase
MMSERPTISVITAFLNEEPNLPVFRDRLMSVLRSGELDYELVLVDDHSTDGSPLFAKGWADEDPNVHYIRLARNFGSHTAFAAGLAACTGDCAVFLSSDLQDPPETLPRLLEQWHSGNDVVWAVRQERLGESRRTKALSRLFHWVMRWLTLPELPEKGADFLLLDRKVIDAYNSISEKHTTFGLMILWLGFRQSSIQYVKEARFAGSSKWTWSKKIKVTIDSLVSFSYAPIRLASQAGLLISMLGFVYALIVIINALRGQPVLGWSSLMVVVLLLGGFQLLMLGVFGEYLWRTYDEVRGRPRYVIEESYRRKSDGSVAPGRATGPRSIEPELAVSARSSPDRPSWRGDTVP